MQATAPPKASQLPWQKAVAKYQKSDTRTSIIQLFTSIPPFFVCWYLAYRSLEVSYVLTLVFAFFAAMFVMRSFIIFHDCGHGSFFKSQKVNDIIGVFTGIMAFTPYFAWRHSHAVHHATSGDLDRRGVGDVWTLTYDEYQKLSRGMKIFYRVYRNPFMIFVIGPTIDFLILQRLPMVCASDKAREKNSVVYTNLSLLALAILMSLLIGVKAFVLVQLPIIAFASSTGVWLFYLQHQYENVYWERHEEWDYASAALYGSSFFKMPRIMQWFHRQYRLPPHSSPQPTHPELQS